MRIILEVNLICVIVVLIVGMIVLFEAIDLLPLHLGLSLFSQVDCVTGRWNTVLSASTHASCSQERVVLLLLLVVGGIALLDQGSARVSVGLGLVDRQLLLQGFVG